MTTETTTTPSTTETETKPIAEPPETILNLKAKLEDCYARSAALQRELLRRKEFEDVWIVHLSQYTKEERDEAVRFFAACKIPKIRWYSSRRTRIRHDLFVKILANPSLVTNQMCSEALDRCHVYKTAIIERKKTMPSYTDDASFLQDAFYSNRWNF